MKTLDEVIKANECCDHGEPDSRCEDCPYNGIGSCCLERENDALHYLKEYRDKAHRLDIDIAEHARSFEQLGVEKARYQEAVKNCETAENRHKAYELGYIRAMADYEELKNFWAESQANPPLTFDELKQMKGKPVWVELRYPEGGYSHWGIIEGFQKVGYEFITLRGFHQIDSFGLMDKEMGKTWQAYRKERE